jgi:transposase
MAWQRGRSYSQDLRERVLAVDDLTCAQAATRFSVSISYVVKARQRRDQTGSLTTKQRGYRRPALLAGLKQAIASEIERRPSITLAELREWLVQTHAVSASMGTVWNAVDQLGLTLKKSRSARPSKAGPILPPHGRTGIASNRD